MRSLVNSFKILQLTFFSSRESGDAVPLRLRTLPCRDFLSCPGFAVTRDASRRWQ